MFGNHCAIVICVCDAKQVCITIIRELTNYYEQSRGRHQQTAAGKYQWTMLRYIPDNYRYVPTWATAQRKRWVSARSWSGRSNRSRKLIWGAMLAHSAGKWCKEVEYLTQASLVLTLRRQTP